MLNSYIKKNLIIKELNFLLNKIKILTKNNNFIFSYNTCYFIIFVMNKIIHIT